MCARTAVEKGERIGGMTRTYEGRQLKGEAGPGSADRSPKQMQSGRDCGQGTARRGGDPTIRRSAIEGLLLSSLAVTPCSRYRLKLSNVSREGSVHFEEPLRTETNQLFVLAAMPPPPPSPLLSPCFRALVPRSHRDETKIARAQDPTCIHNSFKRSTAPWFPGTIIAFLVKRHREHRLLSFCAKRLIPTLPTQLAFVWTASKVESSRE